MIIALNLKAYNNSLGKNCLKYLRAAEKIAKEYRNEATIIFIPNISDLSLAKLNSKYVKIFSPVVSNIEEEGAYTGKVTFENLKFLKVDGLLLNHSENRIEFELLKELVEKAKKYNLETLVCAKDLDEAKKILKLKPTYLAYEDPLLIGSGIAISKAKASDVKKFAELVKNESIPLCGAGISNKEDVKMALELGTKGVLIASAFVKAKSPTTFLREILKITEKNQK